jgi:hypothetical protein
MGEKAEKLCGALIGGIMQGIKGSICKNGTLIFDDVEFNILTQVIGGSKSTTGSFQLPASRKLPSDPYDLMYDAELQDGRSFTFAISSRIADEVLQHFNIKILGL